MQCAELCCAVCWIAAPRSAVAACDCCPPQRAPSCLLPCASAQAGVSCGGHPQPRAPAQVRGESCLLACLLACCWQPLCLACGAAAASAAAAALLQRRPRRCAHANNDDLPSDRRPRASPCWWVQRVGRGGVGGWTARQRAAARAHGRACATHACLYCAPHCAVRCAAARQRAVHRGGRCLLLERLLLGRLASARVPKCGSSSRAGQACLPGRRRRASCGLA